MKKLITGLMILTIALAPALGFGATQDFKGTINGNTITAGTGTVTISAGKTITATESTSLDEAVSMSSKAPKSGAALTGATINTAKIARNTAAGMSGSGGTLTATLSSAMDANTIALIVVGGYLGDTGAVKGLYLYGAYGGAFTSVVALPAGLTLSTADNTNFVLTNTTGFPSTLNLIVIH